MPYAMRKARRGAFCINDRLPEQEGDFHDRTAAQRREGRVLSLWREPRVGRGIAVTRRSSGRLLSQGKGFGFAAGDGFFPENRHA